MKSNTVWRPLNSISGAKSIAVESGDRIYLTDKRGKTYIDALCGLWNVSLGYGNQKLMEKIKEQMCRLPFVNLTEFQSELVEELGTKILELLDADMQKVYFTCTGSESNELAIKLARKYHSLNYSGKTKIGVLKSSYHGSFYGSLSASQYEEKHKEGYGPFLTDFVAFDLPFCRCCRQSELSDECLDRMIQSLEEQFHKEELAAFLIEPVVGSGGIIPIPELYLHKLEKLCNENDVLLILDEVATGFGRTGKMFCYQHAGIKPDIVCMAKGINSGYLPMGAVAVNQKVHDVFNQADMPLFHLSTQNGNPICCSAAIETIRQLTEQEGRMVAYVKDMGEYLISRLWDELKEHPYVADIRGQGFMVAIDLVESKVTGEQFTQEHLVLLVEKLKKVGILVESCYNEGVTSTVSLFFSFIITKEEIEMSITKITKGLYNFI